MLLRETPVPENLTQVFSCKNSEFFKNTFLRRISPAAASVFQIIPQLF